MRGAEALTERLYYTDSYLREFSARIVDRSEDGATVWRHLAKDGHLLDVEVSSRALKYAGRSSRIVVINDLTERRRAEAFWPG